MPADSTLLASWLSRDGDARPAVHDPSGSRTWSALVEQADRVASTLLRGRRSLEGERVALLISPGADFVACFFGVLRAGGAVVVLSPLHPAPETRYFCEDAGVGTIVASAALAERVSFLVPERRVLAAAELVTQRGPTPPASMPANDAPALQLYT
ncbi:MAG: AMP-binding protein, partial [Polyangiaceae bacterium]